MRRRAATLTARRAAWNRLSSPAIIAAVAARVRIGPSMLAGAGEGAFWGGDTALPPGVRVGVYTGATCPHADHTDHSYCLHHSDGVCVNGTSAPGWARYVNDGRGTRPSNLRFGSRGGGMFTTRKIAPGDELLVSYGRGYWVGSQVQ